MDPVFNLIEQEKQRQKDGIELIPSENYVSKDVLSAMGSVFTNKYSEGYPSFDNLLTDDSQISSEILPNFRYYGGQVNVDRIERLAISRAMRLFHADHANVQPHSGANANEAVYFAWCQPGDTILSMALSDGGHLTHGSPVTRSAKIYNFVNYHVVEDENGYDIDYDELERLAMEYHPKIILVGYSAFMNIPDFDRVAAIGRSVGSLLMADMAHVAGLIAGGVHPNPLEHGFHVMTATTHKTLRGPRGGLILSMGNVSSPLKKPEHTIDNIPTLIDRAVFPGTQGGPLEHIIAAKAVAFNEALKPEFREYAQNILDNASVLSNSLKEQGFTVCGNGTKNHLILIDMVKGFGLSGKIYEKALDMIGLTLNANSIPSDQGGSFNPSGVRLGTPAATTRGMGEEEMVDIAKWMKGVVDVCLEAKNANNASDNDLINYLSAEPYKNKLDSIHNQVIELANRFPVPGI